MRQSFLLTLSASLALVSCGHANRPDARNDVDLQRDLKLAATSTSDLAQPQVNPANFNRLETAPTAELHEARHLVKAPGPKAVASRTADLKASAIPQVSATTNVPQVEAVAPTPVPQEAGDPVASLPSAPSTPAPSGAVGSGDYGGSSAGSAGHGSGWGIGPIIGVVIRGGGMDGDHCEPHGPGRLPPGVYFPQPGGFGGSTRFPATPRGGGVMHLHR